LMNQSVQEESYGSRARPEGGVGHQHMVGVVELIRSGSVMRCMKAWENPSRILLRRSIQKERQA